MHGNAHPAAETGAPRPHRAVPRRVATGLLLAALLGVGVFAVAQQPQIPTLQVADETRVKGKGQVKIFSRVDATHTGTFEINIDVQGIGPGGYPAGTLAITKLSMSDATLQGTITATSIEQVTSTGKATPTVFLNGRCKADNLKGGRFWMMIANNGRDPGVSQTPDIVSFLVFDVTGKRVAYGTGPLVKGDIQVSPTSN